MSLVVLLIFESPTLNVEKAGAFALFSLPIQDDASRKINALIA